MPEKPVIRVLDDDDDVRDVAVTVRIALPEMLPDAGLLPHLKCSRPMIMGGDENEAGQHCDAK
jgi:hypothetical protein